MDIKIVCRKCRGTGELQNVGGSPYNCDRCSGTGRLDEGEIGSSGDTLEEKLDDILTKCNDNATEIASVKQKCDEIKAVVDAL